MSITDELRELQESWKDIIGKGGQSVIANIADRIDDEHERECKEQHACGVEHGIAASIEASMLQDHGYIALPKDADGVPIHIGDKVQQRDHAGKWTGPLSVMAVTNVGCYVMAYGTLSSPLFHVWGTDVRRYHEPTVEDVLREFAGMLASAENNWGSDVNDAISEYAAKLQLKESE